MNEITEYLSNIEYEQLLAESAVCEALYQEYQKQMLLMEQCEIMICQILTYLPNQMVLKKQVPK